MTGKTARRPINHRRRWSVPRSAAEGNDLHAVGIACFAEIESFKERENVDDQIHMKDRERANERDYHYLII